MPERIKDKKHLTQLIIEETGCDAEQAKLVLDSTGNDVGKSIKIINSLLKQIMVLKGKFKAETTNIYGLVVLIADIKNNQLLRATNIVTYNPGIYQTGLDQPWHEFERKLYALRLGEGSLQELTQKLQNNIKSWINKDKDTQFFEALVKNNRELLESRLVEEIKEISQDQNIKLDIQLDEVNLLQFKELKEKIDEDISKLQLPENLVVTEETAALVLEIEMVGETDKKGRLARELKPGETVWAKLTDERDIAQYLAKLLGGRVRNEEGREELIPLTAPVEEVEPGKEKVRVKVRFGPAIMGLAELSPDDRVSVITNGHKLTQWWKDLLRIFSLQK